MIVSSKVGDKKHKMGNVGQEGPQTDLLILTMVVTNVLASITTIVAIISVIIFVIAIFIFLIMLTIFTCIFLIANKVSIRARIIITCSTDDFSSFDNIFCVTVATRRTLSMALIGIPICTSYQLVLSL